MNANQVDSGGTSCVVQDSMAPNVILERWIQSQINDTSSGRRFGVLLFAERIGVTNRSLWLWRRGRFSPKPQYRPIIERLTDGAVPASIWER